MKTGERLLESSCFRRIPRTCFKLLRLFDCFSKPLPKKYGSITETTKESKIPKITIGMLNL